MIYLDFASTTKTDDDIMNTFLKVSKDHFAHPGTISAQGLEAARLVDETRKSILQDLKLKDYNVVYTSGGTEANNIAIQGYAKTSSEKKHFITSITEHSSVFDTFKYLEEIGHEVTYLNVDRSGTINLPELKEAIKKNTFMISIMAVNNEVGTINDVQNIRQIANENKITFMTDFVQGLGKVDSSLLDGVDIITISSHKINGVKGVGAVIYKKNIILKPLVFGGNGENYVRPGSQNPAMIVAFAHATRKATENLKKNIATTTEVRKYLIDKINELNNVTLITVPVDSIANVVNVAFGETPSEAAINIFNQNNIVVSAMSACSIKEGKPSRVIYAMTKSELDAKNSIRISISYTTTIDEIDKLVEVMKTIR